MASTRLTFLHGRQAGEVKQAPLSSTPPEKGCHQPAMGEPSNSGRDGDVQPSAQVRRTMDDTRPSHH